MSSERLVEAATRAAFLLEVVDRYMSENGWAAEGATNYDDAECDGCCLGEDCRVAALELRMTLAKTSGEAA
jgi:hypothetical protein